jgi:copper chaperone CopZ
MCSKSIYKALEKIPSVQTIEVDLDQSIFRIQFKEGSSIQPDELKEAVMDAGFAVASLQMTAIFPETKISKDVHIPFFGSTYHFLNGQDYTISGKVILNIVDKNFVTTAAFRQYKKMTTMSCIETGKAQACCSKNIISGSRVYHVTL